MSYWKKSIDESVKGTYKVGVSKLRTICYCSYMRPVEIPKCGFKTFDISS